MFYIIAPTCLGPDSKVVFGTCNTNFLKHRFKSKVAMNNNSCFYCRCTYSTCIRVINTISNFFFLNLLQRDMFSSTMDGANSGNNASFHIGDRKGATGGLAANASMAGGGGGMKNKWVKAFKSIKGKPEPTPAPGMAQVVEGIR